MRAKREFQIYPRTYASGNQGWMVSMGIIEGRRRFKSFSSLEAAQHFKARLEQQHALHREAAFSELDELGRATVRYALAKLKPYEASIVEAVDFFIRYGKPPKGKITIQEAISLFQQTKTKENVSPIYLRKCLKTFFPPFLKAFQNCYLNEITREQAKNYIFNQSTWGNTTKNTHLNHLSSLYSFARDYAPINVFDFKGPKTVQMDMRSKVLTVQDTERLLRRALMEGKKAECAALVLVLFCGVRMEEVTRAAWEVINLEGVTPRIDLTGAMTKTGKRRVIDIPENALEWLRVCKAKGSIVPDNFEKRMQRLRKKAMVNYPQNAARHSFASYHVAKFNSPEATAKMLGHPTPSLLYRTYYEVVSPEDAESYWKIAPING